VGRERAVGLVVSSYAIDDGGSLLLFDSVAPPSEIVELGAGRETSIVLTCPWHERDTRSLVRFGCRCSRLHPTPKRT
jgi:hypothetical protein